MTQRVITAAVYKQTLLSLHSLMRHNRNALPTIDTELKLMAAAILGDRSKLSFLMYWMPRWVSGVYSDKAKFKSSYGDADQLHNY